MRWPGISQSSYSTSPANNILSCYIFNLLILSIDLSIKFVIADQHNTTVNTNTNEIFTTNSYSLIQQTQEQYYQHEKHQQQQQQQVQHLDVNIRKDQLFVNEINDKISNEHNEKHRQVFTKLMTSPLPLMSGVVSTTTVSSLLGQKTTKIIKPTMRTLIVVGGRGSNGHSVTNTGGNIKSYNEKFVDISKLDQLDNQLGGDDFLIINGSNTLMKNMYFGTDNLTTVTYQAGSVAQLPCTVFYLGDHTTISWIRRKDYHLLTVGITTYSSDERFSALHHEHSEDWALQIKFVQMRDAGMYECQVSTHPPTSIFLQLNVIEARAEMLGQQEKYLKPGSLLRLTCKVLQSTEPPLYLFWYHNNRMINYDLHRGVNVSTESDNRYSELLITQTSVANSGNYSCVPNNAIPASIMVHILNGENPAAMQHGEHSGCIRIDYKKNIKYYLLILMVMVSAFLLLPIPSTIITKSLIIELLLFIFIFLPIIFTIKIFKYVKIFYKIVKSFFINYFYYNQLIQQNYQRYSSDKSITTS